MDTVPHDLNQISLFGEAELPAVEPMLRAPVVAATPPADDDLDDEPPPRVRTPEEQALYEINERRARARMKRVAAQQAWARGKPANTRRTRRWGYCAD